MHYTLCPKHCALDITNYIDPLIPTKRHGRKPHPITGKGARRSKFFLKLPCVITFVRLGLSLSPRQKEWSGPPPKTFLALLRYTGS